MARTRHSLSFTTKGLKFKNIQFVEIAALLGFFLLFTLSNTSVAPSVGAAGELPSSSSLGPG